jgi:hypothetical protein
MLNVVINTEYGEYLETATANIKDYIREGAFTFNITIFSLKMQYNDAQCINKNVILCITLCLVSLILNF